MAYTDHFQLVDDLISHLDGVMSGISDPFISSRYVGFVSVVAVTVYELAIKEIFLEFSRQKHKVLGNFATAFFERLNGRIKTRELRENYIPRFGDQYVKKYRKLEQEAENRILKANRVSMLARYNNIIEWRNQFAHEGKIPSTASYNEVTDSYRVGKEVIHCLARAMRR